MIKKNSKITNGGSGVWESNPRARRDEAYLGKSTIHPSYNLTFTVRMRKNVIYTIRKRSGEFKFSLLKL